MVFNKSETVDISMMQVLSFFTQYNMMVFLYQKQWIFTERRTLYGLYIVKYIGMTATAWYAGVIVATGSGFYQLSKSTNSR